MRPFILAMLLAGCGDSGRSDDPTACKVNDAPCCEAPPFECDEPTRMNAPAGYTLMCPTGVYSGHAFDGTLYTWGPDQSRLEQALCWIGEQHVARYIYDDGTKECFDRSGRAADCATVEPEALAAATAYLQAHAPAQE